MIEEVKNFAFSGETRAQTIVRYTQDYMRMTGTKTTTLAVDISTCYMAMVKPVLRTVKFHQGGDAFSDLRANAQIIRRFMDGEHRFPAELEEAWVHSLPDSWRVRLMGELARRYGLLAVPYPETKCEHSGDIAKVLREAGEACSITALMLSNGRFGPEDMPYYDKAQQELDDVIVAVMELKNRIATEVAGKGCFKRVAVSHGVVRH